MNLESFISAQNGVTFWREFTFTQLKFRVPAGELELADNLVWFGDVAFIVQMKERENPTDDEGEERSWFENKIMKAAVKQIKDSMKFLAIHGAIPIANIHQVEMDIRGKALRETHRIIVYKPGASLPPDCSAVRFKESRTAGFIHIFSEADYAQVLRVLIAPEEIRRYLEYRQEALRSLTRDKVVVLEADILAAYASEEPVPSLRSHQRLSSLVEDVAQYDLSSMLHRLVDHIEGNSQTGDHSLILLEFAKLPRSAWRAAKQRLDKVMSHARNDDSIQPYRFYFPATGCSFMFTPLPTEAQNRDDAAELRVAYLETLTETAKYLAKADRGIGVQIACRDQHFLIDWCLSTQPWEHDERMERILEGNPFLPVREQRIDSFHFRTLRG